MAHGRLALRFEIRSLAATAIVLLACCGSPAATKMYWGDSFTNSIYRANLDGSGLETVISLPLAADPLRSGIARLAIDSRAGLLYWTDTNTRLVQRANVDGSNITTLVDLNAIQNIYPGDIELDLVHGKMYFTANGLYRANLDGTQVEPLITDSRIAGIDVDHVNRRLYMTSFVCLGESQGDCVHRSDLDGSNFETLITGVGGAGFDIDAIEVDPTSGKMYYADEDNGRIYEANLDGSNNVLFYEATLNTVGHGLAIDQTNRRLYWANASWQVPDPNGDIELRGSIGYSDLGVPDPNDEFAQTVIASGLPRGIVLDDPLPVPEPHTSSLAFAAAFVIFCARRRRARNKGDGSLFRQRIAYRFPTAPSGTSRHTKSSTQAPISAA